MTDREKSNPCATDKSRDRALDPSEVVASESMQSDCHSLIAQLLLHHRFVNTQVLSGVQADREDPSDDELLDALVDRGYITVHVRSAVKSMAAAITEQDRASQASTGLVDETVSSPTARLTGQFADADFGDYEIIEEIAKGGMGVVYKARQNKLNRLVALKMIRSGEFANEEQIKRFYMEAKAAAKLDHPGIVPVYEVGETRGRHFFSMAFVPGRSLAVRIKESPLEPHEAAELLRKIARAVAYAHQQGVIHRDLKPGNVLLEESGEPRVTDFGLAKQQAEDSDMTATGQILGTPSYMPPEQASGRGDEVDERADVYALGAILYAALTGRPPFQAASALETLLYVKTREPVPPRQLTPSIPRDLETIAAKCLHKDRKRRYDSAAELGDDLQRWLDGRPIRARRVTAVERGVKWCRRNPAVSISGMVVAMVLVVSAMSFYVSSQTNRREQLRVSVDSLETTYGPGIPFALQKLEVYPRSWVHGELTKRMADRTGPDRLALAYGMASLGNVEFGTLIDAIVDEGTDTQEVMNIANALRANREQSLQAIYGSAASVTGEKNWAAKARLAVVALHLQDSRLAHEMLQTRPWQAEEIEWDPIQRTTFIDEFARWPGDADQLATWLADTNVADLCSGISLAIGGVPGHDSIDDDPWLETLTSWFTSASDPATHSAAGWALRCRGLPVPSIGPTHDSVSNRKWHRTPNLTLIKIPPGVVRGANGPVTVEQGFWIADREVTIKLFQRYATEPPAGMEPFSWEGPFDFGNGFDDAHPVQQVSWLDTVQFCNWLSLSEGLTPAYIVTRDSESDTYQITLIPDADGYRLPTVAEWEFACRAGTSTEFCYGDEEAKLVDYAWFSANSLSRTHVGGEKRCNDFGLFDMHGNVWEWCWDQNTSGYRIRCGGAWNITFGGAKSSYNITGTEAHTSLDQGFRVARSRVEFD